MKPTNTSPDHEDTRIGDATSGVVTTVVRQHDLGIGVSGMDESWIKLYRRIESSEIWRMKPDYFKLWVFLLIRAARKPRTTTVNGVPVTLNKGDVLMSVEAIALACKVSEQTVRSFLKWCNRSNMIVKQKSHGVTHLSICNYSRLQESGATEVKQKSIKSATEVQLSREEEVKKVRREEDKTSYSTALSSGELIAELRQNDGGTFPIHAQQVTRWAELYPAVDVIAELRKMMGWLDANPTKRKTRSGMMRFATNWLSKQQDKGGSNAAGTNKRTIGDRVGSVDGVSYLQRIAETTQRITTTKHVSDGHGSRPTDALAAQSQDRGRTGADGIHHSDAD